MASDGDSRGRLLSVGGFLSIVAGVFEIINGVSAYWRAFDVLFFWWALISGQNVWGAHIGDLAQPPPPAPRWPLIMMGFVLAVLGILAIIGGVSAIRRKSFGVSLAGAICALPTVILGVLAIIFVALGKTEFDDVRG